MEKENVLGRFTDEELIDLANELAESETIAVDSKLREISKEIVGGDSLVQILGVGVPLAKELAARLVAHQNVAYPLN